MAIWPLEQRGSTGVDVQSVQYLLNEHQGAGLATDSDFGPLTQAAVKHFQSTHGLADDGIVGNLTWPKLIINVQSGSTGDAVKAVQSQLDSEGDHLAIDGDFGPLTKAAVENFQKTSDVLSVDGIVGPITWNALVVADASTSLDQ